MGRLVPATAKATSTKKSTKQKPNVETPKIEGVKILEAVKHWGLPKPFNSAFLVKLLDDKKTFSDFVEPDERINLGGGRQLLRFDVSTLPDGFYMLKSSGHRSIWQIKDGVASLVEEVGS
jgi:hypothetical protein